MLNVYCHEQSVLTSEVGALLFLLPASIARFR